MQRKFGAREQAPCYRLYMKKTFICRERESDILNNLLAGALGGNGKVVFVAGEAGIGKTTFINNWWNEISRAGKQLPAFGYASCSIPMAGTNVGEFEALQPFADLMQSLVKYEKSSPVRPSKGERKRIVDLILKAAPSWLAVIPVVGTFASAGMKTFNIIKDSRRKTPPLPPFNKGDATLFTKGDSKLQTFFQYTNFITRLSKDEETAGVVLFIDDVHWADASSLDLLFYISRQLKDKRILVLVTYRPEEVQQEGQDVHPLLKVKNEIMRYGIGAELELSYFNRYAIRKYLNDTFDGYKSSAQFESWLEKISGGNVLFVSEFIKTLNEDGYIDASGRIVKDYTEIEEPESVLAVVRERIRRLKDNTVELLRYATAEGEEFTTYILSQIAKKEPLELLPILREAEDVDFIASLGTAAVYSRKKTSKFKFLHALFHKELYEGLTEEERMTLHGLCFEVLKPEWEKDRSNILLSTKLIVHAEKCEEELAAAEIAFSTAGVLWKRFAVTEALEMIKKVRGYEEGIRNLELGIQEYISKFKSEAVYLEAEILSRSGRFDEAYDVYKEAEDLYEKTGNVNGQTFAMNGADYILCRQNKYREGLERAATSLEFAKKHNHKYGMGYAYANMANIYWGLGKLDEALECFLGSSDLTDESENIPTKSFMLNQIGNIYLEMGKYADARAAVEKSIELAKESGFYRGEAAATGSLALIFMETGENGKALGLFEKSLAMQKEVGDIYAQAWLQNHIGMLKEKDGDLGTAIKYQEECLRLAREISHEEEMCLALTKLGGIYRKKGEAVRSKESLDEAMQLLQQIENTEIKAMVHGEMGLYFKSQGKKQEAEKHLKECIEMMKGMKYKSAGRWKKELEGL